MDDKIRIGSLVSSKESPHLVAQVVEINDKASVQILIRFRWVDQDVECKGYRNMNDFIIIGFVK